MTKTNYLLRGQIVCLAAMVAIAGISGCSQLRLGGQDYESTGFQAISAVPQPSQTETETETETKESHESIDDILDRQAATLRAEVKDSASATKPSETETPTPSFGQPIDPVAIDPPHVVYGPSAPPEVEETIEPTISASKNFQPSQPSNLTDDQIRLTATTADIDDAKQNIQSESVSPQLLKPLRIQSTRRQQASSIESLREDQTVATKPENTSIKLTSQAGLPKVNLLRPIGTKSKVASAKKEVTPTESPVVAKIESPQISTPKSEVVVGKLIEVKPIATPKPKPKSAPRSQIVHGSVVQDPPANVFPVVDESLSKAAAGYRKAFSTESVPREILNDANAVAREISNELAAQAQNIPLADPDSDNKAFRVSAVSGIAPLLPLRTEKQWVPCTSCGHQDCAGCSLPAAEPIYQSESFAQPVMPDGGPKDFSPVTVDAPEFAEGSFTPPQIETLPAPQAPLETESILPGSVPSIADTSHVANLSPLPPVTPGPTLVPPVGLETLIELNTVTWQSRLDQAIELVQKTRVESQSQEQVASMEVSLRLLRALRGQMDHIQKANPAGAGMNDKESRYWQHQLEAITSMLEFPVSDQKAVTDYPRHQAAHETLDHLRMAVAQLESMANLKISQGQLCTDIMGFGQYRLFDSNRFKPGQKMLVYCEVDNYRSMQQQSATGTTFRTQLRGSFAIYDKMGKVVQQAEFPSVEDIARTRRRDFYMYLPVTLGELPPGDYVLHVLVEDLPGNKTASLDPPIKFSIGGQVATLPGIIR